MTNQTRKTWTQSQGRTKRIERQRLGMFANFVLFLLCQTSRADNDEARVRSSRQLFGSSRRDRFPSLEERLKVYMSNWYIPPCEGQEHATYSIHTEDRDWPMVSVTDLTAKNETKKRVLNLENMLEPDQLFWFDNDVVTDCARSAEEYIEDAATLPTDSRIKFRSNMRMYCQDAKEVISIMNRLRYEQHESDSLETPLLFQFGDMKHSHFFKMVNVPHIKKFRSGTTRNELERVTTEEGCFNRINRPALQTNHEQVEMSPIVWKLATHRHYRILPEIRNLDTPWGEKYDKAIFRGQLTGALTTYNKRLSDDENCRNMIRCRLVLESNGSQYVDAKLTTTRKRLSNVIAGVSVVETKKPINELLKYKGIVMIEGNDVASGLKWALLSQSVVLMPRPMFTSWAMEELLEPWVHYVPLNDELDDVEEKMKWVVENEIEAREISERATLWMEDLEFHPDAKREERIIKEEIIKRYQAHFRAG